MPDPHADGFYDCLAKLDVDVTVSDFLKRHFSGPEHSSLRRKVVRMVEGYDAADPARASMSAVRDEWTNSNRNMQARIVGGYGALIDFLTAGCRTQGATIHLHAAVSEIETTGEQALVRCANGDSHLGDAAILTVPLPVLKAIMLPPAVREMAAPAEDIGFGNVMKLLLHFKSRWWTTAKGKDLSDLLFLLSDETIPVWWTQRPAEHPVLTGWVAGPRTERIAHLDENELVETGGAHGRVTARALTRLRHVFLHHRAGYPNRRWTGWHRRRRRGAVVLSRAIWREVIAMAYLEPRDYR
jgi:monoamine oxidase